MPEWMFFLDDLEQICDPYCLQFWQTIGIIAAAIATTAAVFVSLALARREAPRVEVSAVIRFLVTPGRPPPDGKFPENLAISIRNIGDRPVKIQGVGWRGAPWRKLHGLQNIPPQATGLDLPQIIEGGDALDLYVPLDSGQVNWLRHFARDFFGRLPLLELRFLRVVVWTPAGHTFRGKIDSGLQRRLIDELKRQRDAPAQRD